MKQVVVSTENNIFSELVTDEEAAIMEKYANLFNCSVHVQNLNKYRVLGVKDRFSHTWEVSSLETFIDTIESYVDNGYKITIEKNDEDSNC